MSATSPIYVVSGLPRSGTSLMMQILASGGIEPLLDNCRPPDRSNPHGYFEFEPVKRLSNDHSWIDQACGKVVKVISPLLQFLPPTHSYRVILMERSLDEVLDSQSRMLGKEVALSQMALLRQSFSRHAKLAKQLVAGQSNFSGLIIQHQQLLENPGETIEQICSFLQPLIMNKSAMLAAIDPGLYRCRGN